MKRTVTGPNGIMTVYGNEHLTDDQLKEMAASLAIENAALIHSMRRQLLAGYSITRREDDDFGSTQHETFDDMGAGVARAYGLTYGGMLKPAGQQVVIFTIEDLKFRINVSDSLQTMRDELTGLLKAHGFRSR